MLAALLMVIFIFFIIGQGLAVFMVQLIYKLSFIQIGLLVKSPAENTVAPIKLLQIIASSFQFIGAGLFFSWINAEPDFLKIRRSVNLGSLLLACTIIIACIPLISWMGALNAAIKFPAQLAWLEQSMKQSEQSIDHLVRYLLMVHHPVDIAVNLLMIALIPAIGEEIIFRGCLQQIFIKAFKNPHIGILVTAIIFSAVHFQFYGFLPRVFLGMLLGYLFYWSKSIWLSAGAHFFNNGLAVLSASVSSMHTKWLDSDSVAEFSWWWILLSALLVAAGMNIIHNIYVKRRENTTLYGERLG